MAATIKIKNSSTAGAAPTSSDLVQGELAVNVTDKRLYTENASGTVVELGTNPSVPVTFPDGSASAPSLTNDGDTNTGLFFPAADTVGIATGGTERARVDSSGTLGLGVTPSAWYTSGGYKVMQIGPGMSFDSGNDFRARVASNAYVNTSGDFKYVNTGYASNYNQTSGQHQWFTAASGTAGNTITFTQAMTLDASGNLLIGKTSTGTAGQGAVINANGNCLFTVTDTGAGDTLNVWNGTANAYRFYVTRGGTIFATSTTISAISDQRLKENVQDLDAGLDAVMALKPRKFDWKEGKGKNIKGDRGWIAQEFEQVFPDLIDEWRDPAPEGEEPYKSVRQDLIPVLVKAIQELKTELDAAKARITALEAA